jgi:hypothetical protein
MGFETAASTMGVTPPTTASATTPLARLPGAMGGATGNAVDVAAAWIVEVEVGVEVEVEGEEEEGEEALVGDVSRSCATTDARSKLKPRARSFLVTSINSSGTGTFKWGWNVGA